MVPYDIIMKGKVKAKTAKARGLKESSQLNPKEEMQVNGPRVGQVIDGWVYQAAGLHFWFHPTIRDGSTWSKFGARGEHGDVFLFSNLGAL